MLFNLFSRPKNAKDKEILNKINGLEAQIAGLKDDEIKERSLALKNRAACRSVRSRERSRKEDAGAEAV